MRNKLKTITLSPKWRIDNIPRLGNFGISQREWLENNLGFDIEYMTSSFGLYGDMLVLYGRNRKLPSLKHMRAENSNITYLDIYTNIRN